MTAVPTELPASLISTLPGRSYVEEALFTREASRIALVILDVIMPKLGGWPAFKKLEKLRPGLKAIFVSGYAAEAAGIAELVTQGRAGLMPKPFHLADVNAAFASADAGLVPRGALVP